MTNKKQYVIFFLSGRDHNTTPAERQAHMSRSYFSEDKKADSYDYKNQVWIRDGKYQDCGHPQTMDCRCFGRIHKNELATITEDCQ